MRIKNLYDRFRLSLWLALLALAAAGPAGGQGTVLFANDPASGINAPFFDIDGTTRLSGAGFTAELYGGAVGTPPGALTKLGQSVFRTGAAAGFWISKKIVIPGVWAGQKVALQVRFYDNQKGSILNFAQAEVRRARIGVSDVLTATLASVLPRVPNEGPPLNLAEAESPGMNIGLSGVPMLTPASAPAVGQMAELSSSGMIPTLTLNRGTPQVSKFSGAVPSGLQGPKFCDVRVGSNYWFRLTNSSPGVAVISTAGTTMNTVMAAYSGSIVDPKELVCNDDRAPGQTVSEVHFPVEPGKLYYIRVAGKNGASGKFQITRFLGTVLSIRPLANHQIELSWPADATNFVLESARISPPGPWTLVTSQPIISADRKTLKVSDMSAAQNVYRLRRP